MTQHFFPTNTPATYFAVERLANETVQDVAEAVLYTAFESGIKFGYLEAGGPLEIGGMKFVRFRIDRQHAMDLASELVGRQRGCIWNDGSGYVLRCGGRSGKVPMTRVIVVPCPNDRVLYVGTRGKHWQRQFAPAA